MKKWWVVAILIFSLFLVFIVFSIASNKSRVAGIQKTTPGLNEQKK